MAKKYKTLDEWLEEQAVRDKEIQNYIDAIMKKAFGS